MNNDKRMPWWLVAALVAIIVGAVLVGSQMFVFPRHPWIAIVGAVLYSVGVVSIASLWRR